MSEKYQSPQQGYAQPGVPQSYQQPAQPGYQQPIQQQPSYQQPPQPAYQPQASAHSHGTHQPPQGGLTHQGPPQQSLGSEWGHSFWDCCSPADTCLCGWCVPCMLFGKTEARMKDPNLSDFSYCNGNCCGWYCAMTCGCAWIFQGIKRGEMREKFGIEGNVVMDFLGACCCPCCGLVQQEKEAVRRHEAGQGQGYQKTPGMSYP